MASSVVLYFILIIWEEKVDISSHVSVLTSSGHVIEDRNFIHLPPPSMSRSRVKSYGRLTQDLRCLVISLTRLMVKT